MYLSTIYKENTKSKEVITKHHLFLDRPYLVKYENVRYNLTLKKIDKNKVNIEAEILLPINKKFEVVSGKTLIGPLNQAMTISTPFEKQHFNLKLVFEKVVDDPK